MQVHKFGGASIKDAEALQNVVAILNELSINKGILVASAMGKTTNALELVVEAYFNNKDLLNARIDSCIHFHVSILQQLFAKSHPVHVQVLNLFKELSHFLALNKSPQHNFVYDQVVSYGELVSTTIIHRFLEESGFKCQWLDARTLIKTNNNNREATVDWQHTQEIIKKTITPNTLYLTQGFIGSDSNNFTTTLGREGSDYTGAIFAYCLNAESLTIWKNVPGVLNGDPAVFENTQLLHHISYEEAIELAFYGASVIHPKTLQPLQRKEIPLCVKSFNNPQEKGTAITKGKTLDPLVPCYIVKQNQILIAFSALDFSFIMEDHIGDVFKLLATHKIKVNLIQNSAISFSICIQDLFGNIAFLAAKLRGTFRVNIVNDVSLFTIRHATPKAIASLEKNKEILLKQVAGDTIQLIVKSQ